MCLNLRFNILKPIGYVMNGVHSASWGQLRSYLNEKSSGSRSRKQRLTAVGTCCADHVTPLYPQKVALTSPTGGGRSVGIVRMRTKATEFRLVLVTNCDKVWTPFFTFSRIPFHILLCKVSNTHIKSISILCKDENNTQLLVRWQ